MGGESARRWHGKMKSMSPSRSKVKDQPVLETPRLSLLREADAVGTAVTAILKTGR